MDDEGSKSKKLAETQTTASAEVLKQAIGSTEGVIRELLRSSAASPIIAAATVIILSDILASKGVITKTASTNLNDFIIAVTAATVLTEVLKSGVQTLVYAEGGGLAEAGIGALVGAKK